MIINFKYSWQKVIACCTKMIKLSKDDNKSQKDDTYYDLKLL